MPEINDIPHLLALIDDESPEVQENVLEALRSFGPSLEQAALPYRASLSEIQQQLLDHLALELRPDSLEPAWLHWLDTPDERLALEKALSNLAYLEYGSTQPRLEQLLDQLARRYQRWGRQPTIENLMRFLFEEEGFSPPKEDYYDPRNSNLVYVIQEREGIQISLSALAILLARRLGIGLYGLNVPRHFMTISFEEGDIQVYDCFNKGRRISDSMVEYLKRTWTVEPDQFEMLQTPAFQVVIRVLQNILNARMQKGLGPEVGPYKQLFDELVGELKRRKIIE